MQALGGSTDVVGTHARYSTASTVHLDLTDRKNAANLARSFSPRVVYLPASQTNVEECEKEPDRTYATNVADTIAFIQALDGVPIVYYSSEYVFDGASGPYDETRTPSPINQYGCQKLAVERFLLERGGDLIVRTVHLFGAEYRQKNFVYGLIRSLTRGEPFVVAADQISTPTSVTQLASASVEIVSQQMTGVVHLVGADRMSRFSFAGLVAEALSLDTSLIIPKATEDMGSAARRPLSAGLVSNRVCYADLGLTGIHEALKLELPKMRDLENLHVDR